MLRKHPAEQLVIRKTMPFQNILQRVLRRDQILINMGQPYFALVFQKGKPHMLFKKAAEIPRIQMSNPGNFRNGDRAAVILIDVV